MPGKRVFISGMGGELGSRVVALLEDEPWVGDLAGIDADPPRRRLRAATFHRVPPAETDRIVQIVADFDPHVLVHVASWEPDARAGTGTAKVLTDHAATSVLGAAAECKTLQAVVVRSGIEVYGRARGSLTRPDEDTALNPTSEYGRMLDGIETTARAVGQRVGVPVTLLRLAPVLGPHVPSPLGRVLRQPVVPFSALADPPFTVVQDHDAAVAICAAARQRHDGPVNVVAPGSISTFQAIRRGGRIPLPLLGPEWRLVRALSWVLGAPIPDHVAELFHRGRLADDSRAKDVLGVTPAVTAVEVIDRLHAWESVVRVPPRRQVA